MNSSSPHLVHSGAAMDAIVPQDGRRQLLIRAGVVVLVAAVLGAGWWQMPRGLQVPAVDVRTAVAASGVFYDDVALRAKAVALDSVVLDAVDGGRVEEVLVRDGALVKKGDVLFRISNPQRNLELLQRQSELAQQISNLSSLKVDFESSRTDHQRRAEDIRFNLDQAQKKQARSQGLAQQGFISDAALAESNDAVENWRRHQRDESQRDAVETAVKRTAMSQLERAVEQIQRGLALVSASVDALVVRAPAAGRLTDFSLQIGATVKNDQHIGRIDDPSRFKLTAQVDEFYLSRMRVGLQGSVKLAGKDLPIVVARIFPQVTDGRFSMELEFKAADPTGLSPGQSLDAQVTLGEPGQALVLPNAPFLNDSGGAWAYVLASNGRDAEKRMIRIGRRNNRQVEVLSGLAAGEKVIVSSYASFGSAPRVQLK
jgi:HlyD family secretion protein